MISAGTSLAALEHSYCKFTLKHNFRYKVAGVVMFSYAAPVFCDVSYDRVMIFCVAEIIIIKGG